MGQLSPMARAGIALGFVFLSCLCCGGFFVGMAGLGSVIESRVSALTAACDGRGVPEAAAYVPGPGVHLTTAFGRGQGTWHYEQRMVPSAWGSSETASTELVLCFEDEQEGVVESCPYTTGMVVSRIQFARQARLVVAQTGQVLSNTMVMGGDPAACLDWASGGGNVRYEGTHVDGDAVQRIFRGTIGP